MSKIPGFEAGYTAEIGEQLSAGAPSFEPVPPGWYAAEVVSAESRETKAGGEMLCLSFQLDNGRRVWTNLNMVCPSSEIAEKIARQQFAAFMKAAGVEEVSEISELIGLTAEVKVTVSKDRNGEDRNDIRGYR
jgi:hypothetical protein